MSRGMAFGGLLFAIASLLLEAEVPLAPRRLSPAHQGFVALFPGCDAPLPFCDCDDRVLAAPHLELDLGPSPEPTSGQLVIASVNLRPLEVTYFAPMLIDPPGICLSGRCPEGGPVRFELVGPGGRISRHYGTWSCSRGGLGGYCKGPSWTWRGTSMTDAWLDIAPDDDVLRLFVADRLVYSIARSERPLGARAVLLTEPEYALALSFGEGDPEGAFVAVGLQGPMVEFPGTSIKVRRRPEGCWSLIELGDLPFADPLWVSLADGFRTAMYELPLQDGVPPAALPNAASHQPQTEPRARAPLSAYAHLARHVFPYGEQLGAVDLASALLRKAYFRSVGASGARLHDARLQQAYLRRSDFARADFSEADLSGAYLIGTNLQDADFRGANLARTRLDRCSLRGANLEQARNLTQAQLDSACGDSRTKLPPGLSIARCAELDGSPFEASEEAAWPAGETSPVDTEAELLVARPSERCTTKRCLEPCCNTCGPTLWKLSSDANVEVISRGAALPERLASECGLHYDLRAHGHRMDNQFLVRAIKPVPSKQGRRSGTPGKLELRAQLGACTLMGCGSADPCCNTCGFDGWRPKPTLDVVQWSGAALPMADLRACDQGFDLAVTGTWLGPSAFEVKSVRKLRW